MINPDQSSFKEPLNLLKHFVELQNIDFIKFKQVTERQLVTDVLLLLNRIESPTFAKDKSG